MTDRDCLERAEDAEVILCELTDKIQMAATDRKAVKTALANIMNRATKNEKGAANS